MRYLTHVVYFIFVFSVTIGAQEKLISLEEIWKGDFRTEQLAVLRAMQNGKEYSVLNYNPNTKTASIDVYEYLNSKKARTLVTSDDIEGISYFSDYQFSADESKLIIATAEELIYRRSKKGIYFVFDLNSKTSIKISENKIQQPTFSPDGLKIAFSYQNNLFLYIINTQETIQITTDGKHNEIINGITDWVYEEEFSFVRAFDWNKKSDYLAYIRFDERKVPEFSMDVYGEELYPSQYVFKYPKAGETNADVSLHLYSLASKKTQTISPAKSYSDFYIPRLKWTQQENLLSVQYLNRHQNELDLWFVDTKSMVAEHILTEKDEAYVEVTFDLTFLEDTSFIWTSEKDGYNHIYHYSKEGRLINQVTNGNWDVTQLYGYSPKNNRIYYQSVENGSINRDVYSIALNGTNKRRLSNTQGTHNATFSADYNYYINSYSSVTTPTVYSLHESSNGSILKQIKDNERLATKLKDFKLSRKEFSTISVNGNNLNMWMMKPADFNPKKTYPLLMYQYSGPGSQQVANRWNSTNDYWHQMLAQQGIIIACVDGRGTGFKGAAFKKATYLNLVKYETEDQIAAARKLAALPYIDKERIGIWGWSFGGHMSTNCLLKGNEVFAMAIAVAPVTSWRFYDTIYTERYMRTPQENPSGYDDNSPFNYPELLKGNYLLIHGSGDDNVHVQNTMRMVEALIQANKQFEWMIYPDKNHGIYGGNTRLHLYRKMTDFIYKNLKDKLKVKTYSTIDN